MGILEYSTVAMENGSFSSIIYQSGNSFPKRSIAMLLLPEGSSLLGELFVGFMLMKYLARER